MGVAQAAAGRDRVLRFWLRLLVFGVAGPPVGGLATLAAFGPLAFLWDSTALSLREDIVPMLPAAMFFGYVLGGIPALLTGAVDGILAVQGMPVRRRLACGGIAAWIDRFLRG